MKNLANENQRGITEQEIELVVERKASRQKSKLASRIVIEENVNLEEIEYKN